MIVYYAFNDNKPLCFKNEKHQCQIIHYCPHCNSLICGEWATDKLSENIKNAVKDFADIEYCPICHGEFDENERHHFDCKDNDFRYNRYMFRWGIVLKDRYHYILRRDSFNELGISHKEFDELQVGQKIVTDLGPATVVDRISEYSEKYSMIELDYDYYCDNAVKSIAAMLNYNCSKEHNELAKKKLETFIDKCALSAKDAIITPVKTSDNFNLKEYLKQLLLIEKNIFSISKRLECLYFLNYTAEKDASLSEKIITIKDTEKTKKALELCNALKRKKVEKEIKITDFQITYPKKPNKPKIPEKPVLTQPGFFNKKRVLAENAILTEKYEKDLEAYNIAVEKYESKLRDYNETKDLLERQRYEKYNSAVEKAKSALANEITKAQTKYEELLLKQQEIENNAKDIPTPEKAKLYFLKEEIEIAEDLLKNLYKAQNEMYSCEVIFEKYRNFVAVSSFYEYISSGRCESLDGPNGAYNLFENEIRMNMVIGQLNQVIETLEEIKQNQYIIYSAIHESNKYLEVLDSTTTEMLGALGELNEKATSMESYMSKIAYNTKVTAYNTEKTAFYAKKNAELTNALGFMVALK